MIVAPPLLVYVVPTTLDGIRLDRVVSQLAGLSRVQVQRAIEAGEVRVGGRWRGKGELVLEGEEITLAGGREEPNAPAQATPEAPLTVLLATEQILVVDKPSGMPTVPLHASETGTLANALLGHYPELAGIGYSPKEAGLLHRLDTGTSGLLVVARTALAFETLRAALSEERLEKRYLLLCAQEGLPDDGTLAFPITNHPKDQRRVMACIHPRDMSRYRSRPCQTDYTVLKRQGLWALVEVIAHRALRHQLRCHFAAVGHPLLGDTLYGGDPSLSGRHALHASRVSFAGRGGIPAFAVESPLPPALVPFMEPAL